PPTGRGEDAADAGAAEPAYLGADVGSRDDSPAPTPCPGPPAPPHERRRRGPREKLRGAGASGLSDGELLALVLGSGVARRSAMRIGRFLARRPPAEL